MKKKTLIILLICFLFTGCTANVNINVDKNNSVTEEVLLSQNIAELEGYGVSKYVNDEYEIQLVSNNLPNYKVDILDDNENIMRKYSNSYNNICILFKESVFKDYFDDITCTESNNTYEVVASSKYLSSGENELQSLSLNITLPDKAVSSNANEVNENTYTWKFDDGKESKLELKIKKYSNKTIDKQKGDKNSKDTKLSIAIIVLLILVIAFICKILYDKYKSNKMEY